LRPMRHGNVLILIGFGLTRTESSQTATKRHFMTNPNNPSSRPEPKDIASSSEVGASSLGSSTDGEEAIPTREASGSIPLPEHASIMLWPKVPEEFAAEVRRLDRVLLVLGIGLSFLLASFAIRNTDFWMHLATGRLLAKGNYQFGVDPFAFTTTDTSWVNHSW